MGCLFSKSVADKNSPEPPKKEYSWDKRKNIKVEDYILDGLQDKTVVRLPKSIGGQQFVVQNCSNCIIFLLDHTATITVEKCTDCQIVTGPIKGSLFLRNCKGCKVLCACQQFRTRDCSRVDIFLFCMTQPIIEASYKMKFGCYQLWYEGLQEQFQDAGLEVMNNTWSKIYDFTPNPDEGPNWGLVPADSKIVDFFTLKTERQEGGEGDSSGGAELNKRYLPEDMNLKTDERSSVVPMTAGDRGKTSDESCLVVLFAHDDALTTAQKMVVNLQEKAVMLIKSIQLTLPNEKALELFDKAAEGTFLKAAGRGPVIGLEFNANDCTEKCRNETEHVSDGLQVFISDSKRFIDQFYTSNNMQMM